MMSPVRVALFTLLALGCSSSPGDARRDSDSGAQDTGADTDADADTGAAADGGGVEPISTPPNTWTWVPFPGTTCGNGTTAGIGVNAAADPKDLIVSFEGGGACWSLETCFTTPSAVNIGETYDAAKLAEDTATNVIDRSPGAFQERATVVYIPYCTGDLHAGRHVMEYDRAHSIHHTGAANTQAFVDALRATVPNPAHVWVMGSSAGGFGATLNLHRFTEAWPGAEVHLLQDSSPFVEVQANYEVWQAAWELAFPPGCAGCQTSFPAVMSAVGAAHPNTRIGLLHYDNDATIRLFFGYSGSLVPATDALLADQYARPNTKYFVAAGDKHTMLGEAATLSVEGVSLSSWFAGWLLGAPGWQSVR